MRVLTINTWGRHEPYEARLARLARGIDALAPDVCCMQEVYEERTLRTVRDRAGLSHAFHDLETGLALLSRHPLASQGILRYQNRSPSEDYGRGALIARLDAGDDLVVAVTHLSWRAEDEGVRVAQARELTTAVKETGAPSILAGDFNDTPESAVIATVLAAGYVDGFRALHPEDPGLTWDAANPFTAEQDPQLPDRRIDYVFVQARLERGLDRAEVVLAQADEEGVLPSDHYGVLVDLAGWTARHAPS